MGALTGGPLPPDVLRWALDWLTPAEQRLFAKMSTADQKHAVDVARRAHQALNDDAEAAGSVGEETVMAAALLHDIGKTVSGLGLYGRVIATLSGVVAGHEFAEIWQEKSGFTRKVGLYLRYGELGADLLRMADSDPVVVAWATEHHLSEDRWSIPVGVGRLLAAADG